MRRGLIAALVANLFVAAPLAFGAEGDMRYTGSIGLGYQGLSVDTRDPSKLMEYRDLQPGVLTNFEFKGRGDRSYLDAFGENLGRDDQYFDLRGGRYGTLKYQLYSNDVRHNFGSGPGALSPYTSGIGTSTLTGTFPNTNVASWATFDHSYLRRDWGGNFEYSGGSPWYVRADGNEITRKGINVFAGAQGTSPGNGFVDLPAPIDYTTRNLSLEGGYSSKRGHFAVSFMQSNFYNDNEQLNWSNGFFSPADPFNRDTTVLPPDNELRRIAANGNLRQLPLASTLAGRLTYSKLTSNVAVLPTILSTGPTNPSTASSSPTFDGEFVNSTASISLSSHPTRSLDTRLYYNWAKQENKSTQITFTPTAASGLQCSGGPCTPELFEYKKNNVGVEAGYRVTSGNKLTANYDYLDAERERIDFIRNIDNRYSLEWRNASLDSLVARVKYQFLDRNSTYALPASAAAANPMEPFVRRFDLANVEQNLGKVVLDWTPRPLLDLGFEAIYKKNDYKETPLGRRSDERQEYYASLAFGDPKKLRFLIFGDIEFVRFDGFHRVGTGNPDPSAPPSPVPPATATTYNWTAKNKDKSWQVGLGADWVTTPRLTFKASAIYAETDGSVDFTAQPSGGVTPVVPPANLLPIAAVDDTKRTTFNLKGVYSVAKNWELTGGYAYEKYRYSDIGYDNFGYVAGTGTSASYMTGQYAFQPYTANIFYAMGTYKF